MKKIIVIIIIVIVAYLGYNYLNKYQESFFNTYNSTKDTTDNIKETVDNINNNSIYGTSKYYIAENELRYQAYNLLESDLNKVVKDINSNLDYTFYETTFNSDIKDNELILVNKYYKLDSNYVPNNLVPINGELLATKDTVEAYENMLADANKINLNFYITSAYRSYDYQSDLYNNYVNTHSKEWADSYSARPGHSEHQTGLSIDILTSDSELSTFKNTKEYQWLASNSYKYGFILRYSLDNSYLTGYNEEPWHYRYVGVDAATYIYENNITLEEYYAFYVRNDK